MSEYVCADGDEDSDDGGLIHPQQGKVIMICDNDVEDGNDVDDEVDDDGGEDVHPEHHQQRQQDPCAGKL